MVRYVIVGIGGMALYQVTRAYKANIQNETMLVFKPDDGREIQVFIKTLLGTTVTIETCLIDKIEDIMWKIYDKWEVQHAKEGPLPNKQRLIFAGMQLEPHRSLSYYGINLAFLVQLNYSFNTRTTQTKGGS